MRNRRIRQRWLLQLAFAMAALLVLSQVAIAQDSTPTAVEMEGDALVRSLDPTAPPEGWVIPETVGACNELPGSRVVSKPDEGRAGSR